MPRLKFLRDIIAVLINEFQVFKRSKASIIISLIVLPLFFTLSLGGSSGAAGETFSPTADVPIAFVDKDLSVASGRLYRLLSSSGDFNRLLEGYREDNAIASLGTGRLYAVFIIPQGFQEKFESNQANSIICYVDDGEPGLSEAIIAALNDNLQRFDPTIDVQTFLENGSSPIAIINKGAIFSGFTVGITITIGLVVIFATFYEIAGGMAREREEGTYARLLLSPISLGSIMMGKTLFDLVLNIVRTLIVLGFAIYVYGAQINTDMITLLTIALLLSLLTMGFGFLVSALGAGVRAIVIIEFLFILFLFAFSGFIIDRELLRGISQTIAYLLPWAYGIDMLKRTILVGQSFLSLMDQLQFIAAGIILFYVISYVVLKLSRERLAL